MTSLQTRRMLVSQPEGFAGTVLASHFSVNCLAPAVGEVFFARGRVVKAGKKQVFARAELFAQSGDQLKLVATGDAILVPV